MFFQPKLLAGFITVLGIGIPSYCYAGSQCSVSYITIPWSDNLGPNNSVLDCKDESNSKNYSVYLVFKGGAEVGANSSKVATFKVMDNNTRKVVWGPDADGDVAWDQWGIISSLKESTGGTGPSREEKITTEIRVPTKKIWSQQNITISCQKSIVQMRRGSEQAGTNTGSRKCTASLLRSKNMNFELLNTNNCRQGWFGKKICNINLSDKFEWYWGSKPTAVLCNS